MKYQVTWGELSHVVEAVNEQEAWAAFCDTNGSEEARKFPRLHERKVVEVVPPPVVVEPVVETSKPKNVWQPAPKTSKPAVVEE